MHAFGGPGHAQIAIFSKVAKSRKIRDFASAADGHRYRAAARLADGAPSRECRARPDARTTLTCKHTAGAEARKVAISAGRRQ